MRRDLYGGVTAVRDMADDLRAVAELAREAEAGEIPSPDIDYAALMAGPRFFADPRILAVTRVGSRAPRLGCSRSTTAPTCASPSPAPRARRAAAIKIYADLPARLVTTIAAEAHRQGLLVWAHTAVFPTRPAEVMAAGADVVSHACYLAYQADPAMPQVYEDRTPVHEELWPQPATIRSWRGCSPPMKKRGVLLDATSEIFERSEQARKATRRAPRCAAQRRSPRA